MRKVTYSMGVSLDGYIVGPDGGFGWSAPDELEFAALWLSLPKVVFSKTLSAVEGSHCLATRNLAQEIERWRAEPGPGDIAMGGATLAAEAAEWGLIDEYGLRVHPVLVGGAAAWRTEPGGARLRLPATTAARRLREA